MVHDLANVVDSLCAAEPGSLADGGTIVALHRQLERLSAVVTKAAAAFDASRGWEADGARSSAAWLSVRCRVLPSTARRRVRLGRALRSMPATDAAWLAGEIGEAQAQLLAGVRQRVGDAIFDPDETALVDHARALGHRELGRVEPITSRPPIPTGSRRTPTPSARPGEYTSRRASRAAGSWMGYSTQ